MFANFLGRYRIQYLDKRLFVQLNGSRKVIGVLRGYDVRHTTYPASASTDRTHTGLLEYCARRGGGGEGRWREGQARHGSMSPALLSFDNLCSLCHLGYPWKLSGNARSSRENRRRRPAVERAHECVGEAYHLLDWSCDAIKREQGGVIGTAFCYPAFSDA